MDYELVTHVTLNFGILAICAILITFLIDQYLIKVGVDKIKERNSFSILTGLIFGITCVALIATAYQTRLGQVMDVRAAPIIMSGIIGGPLSAIFTAILSAAARFFVGGDFVIGGVASIVIYALLGMYASRLSIITWLKPKYFSFTRLSTIGFVSVLLALPCFFIDQNLERSILAVKAVAPGLLIQNPLGLLILGLALRITLRSMSDRLALEKSTEEIREKSNNLEVARARLWNAIECLPEAFVLYDKDDRLVVCNSRYKQLYERSAEAIQEGASFESIIRFGLENKQYPEAFGREDTWLKDRLELHRNPQGPIEQKLTNDRYLQIHEVKTSLGETVGFRVDVTKLRRQQARLEAQALELTKQSEELKRQASSLRQAKEEADLAAVTDALTGLGNRRGMDLFLNEAREVLSTDQEIVFLHIDIDFFKTINDLYGHIAGDHILIEMAKILNAKMLDQGYIARLGGDEFAICYININGLDTGSKLAQSIVDACQNPIEYNDNKIFWGVSVGVASSKTTTLENLKEDADIALYEAKRTGRNRICIFVPHFRTAAVHRKRTADECMEALLDDQFIPYFQPQVSSHHLDLLGVEVLARWKHPKEGILAPNRFIPILTELGKISQIDFLMLKKALESVARLEARGVKVPKISVNLSLDSLMDSSILDFLRKQDLSRCRIAFELLETIDFDMYDHKILESVSYMKEMGIEVELDDFGSGYSSITGLLSLRPSQIKIDKKLIGALQTNPDLSSYLVHKIIQMGHDLDISVIAEGIETDSQKEVLNNLGCEAFQGFLFARPMSEDDLATWVGVRSLNK